MPKATFASRLWTSSGEKRIWFQTHLAVLTHLCRHPRTEEGRARDCEGALTWYVACQRPSLMPGTLDRTWADQREDQLEQRES